MTAPSRGAVAVTLALFGGLAIVAHAEDGPDGRDWNPRAAAAYLDGRATWWTTWPTAARDHGTFCVSCHTTLPYAMARSALRAPLGESQPAAAEARIVDNIVKRVNAWSEMAPFYPDQTRGVPKTSESRGTEAVMNAVVLAVSDHARGQLTPAGRAAFEHMWALQMKTGDLTGAWIWLNFHNEPWEAPNSGFLGATLAALAVGTAPESYASTPEIQDNLRQLRSYLGREATRQSLFNQLMLLWAGGHLDGLVTADQRHAIGDATFARQRDDGGWSLAALGTWTRADGTALDTASDGCATGLAALALQEAGIVAADPRLARALTWLRTHQDPGGQWTASSLNKARDPASDPAKFMSDAGTAYAVLAMTYRR